MNTTALTYESRRTSVSARAAAFGELTKPKIALLELVTVVVGAAVASSGVPQNAWLVLHAVLGTAMVAASASSLNQVLERESDKRMPRTVGRPLPAGILTARDATFFGAGLVIVGTLYLGLLVNWLTAAIGMLTWVIYVCIYTPLKSRSTANTFVGAVAGGGPVLMGWTAVQPAFATHQDWLLAVTLFSIVFLWQFPHFMAIAWIYRKDYAAVGAKMLTVVDPTGRLAGKQSVLTAALLVPISLYPAVMMRAGPVYFALALVLSVAQLVIAIRFMYRPGNAAARRMLWMSLVYLPVLFALLLLTPFIFPWL